MENKTKERITYTLRFFKMLQTFIIHKPPQTLNLDIKLVSNLKDNDNNNLQINKKLFKSNLIKS